MANNTLFAQITCDSSYRAKPGTYEIVSIPGSSESSVVTTPIVPDYVLCEIEIMRKDTKLVEYQLNSCTLIRIYPRINKQLNSVQK